MNVNKWKWQLHNVPHQTFWLTLKSQDEVARHANKNEMIELRFLFRSYLHYAYWDLEKHLSIYPFPSYISAVSGVAHPISDSDTTSQTAQKKRETWLHIIGQIWMYYVSALVCFGYTGVYVGLHTRLSPSMCRHNKTLLIRVTSRLKWRPNARVYGSVSAVWRPVLLALSDDNSALLLLSRAQGVARDLGFVTGRESSGTDLNVYVSVLRRHPFTRRRMNCAWFTPLVATRGKVAF